MLIYCKTNQHQTQIGFSISSKFGKAVKRNKLKRQLRSIVASVLSNLPNNLLIVFTARSGAATLTYKQLEQNLLQLLTKAQLIDDTF